MESRTGDTKIRITNDQQDPALPNDVEYLHQRTLHICK
jgi:hypothetical protein